MGGIVSREEIPLTGRDEVGQFDKQTNEERQVQDLLKEILPLVNILQFINLTVVGDIVVIATIFILQMSAT